MSIALIICIVGLAIWTVVIRLKDPQPAGLADAGKIMFGVGLLAFLLGK